MWLLLCFSWCLPTQAAVILAYHHVATDTPKSTTISPSQFKAHLQYLKENQFQVVPLSQLVERLRLGQLFKDKTVAITFDDGFKDIYLNAHPMLQQYKFPYTVFINPKVVPKASTKYLTWAELRAMQDDGVIIANHGLTHDSLIKAPVGIDPKAWADQKIEQVEQAEQILKQKLGTSWRYFALPYGEYTPYAIAQLAQKQFTVFTQQSGAIGPNTEASLIPRFPASEPFDRLTTLKTKLHSLPFKVSKTSQWHDPITTNGAIVKAKVELKVDDFLTQQVQCFASNGESEVRWQGQQYFELHLKSPLKTGRTKANCTAPSVSKPGRFYWFSLPWFVPKANGQWYGW